MPGVDVLSSEPHSSLLFPHLVDAAAFMEDEGKLLAQHRKPPLHGHGLHGHPLHAQQHQMQHQHLQQHHQHQHHQQQQQQQHQQQQQQQHQQQQQQQQHQHHQQHHQQHQQHQQHGHQQHQQQQHAQHPLADHNFLAVCAERDALIMQRDTAVAEKEAACAERDAAILQRDTVINEYKVVVVALDSMKAEREAALQGRKRYPEPAAEGSKLLQAVQLGDNCSFPDDYELLSNRSAQIPMGGINLDVDASSKPIKQVPTKETGKKHPRTTPPGKKAAAGGAGVGQAPKRRKSPGKKAGQWPVDGQEFPNEVKLEEGAEPPARKYDSATTPIPYCSCTGATQQCYRWGSGGWQSACCTTGLSQFPLPMNPKKRGSRVAGRKMSAGAFEKLLEKLCSDGVNINYPIDLKEHWAKHGTNRYVTQK